MALNFPSNPSTGDSYSFGDRIWLYNGKGWALQGAKSGNFNSRVYTGDGSTTEFTITTGTTANSVIVSENGVVQEPISDYTVTGNTITFTTAPSNNVKITIHELGYPDDQTYVNVGANIVPSVTETYDLGSADKKWKDLYLSGNTIYLGNTTISSSNNDLVLPANTKVGDSNTSLPAGGAFMFRNKLINGNFDIWQRGTSQTSNGYGSADRWQCAHAGSTKTASQQAFDLGQTDVPNNPKYFMRHVVTSVAGAGNYAILIQKIEGVETLSGKTATVSFWAKADTSKNIAVEITQYFGDGGSPSASVIGVDAQLVALTTSWAKYTITVDIPSVSGKTLGTNGNDFLQFIFWFDAGSTYDARAASLGQQSGTFDIAQVQIEEGSAATPFEIRPPGIENQLCMRYYQFCGTSSSTGPLCPLYMGTATSARFQWPLTVPLRNIPSIQIISGTPFARYPNSAMTGYVSTNITSFPTAAMGGTKTCSTSVGFIVTVSTGLAGGAGLLVGPVIAYFDAEL